MVVFGIYLLGQMSEVAIIAESGKGPNAFTPIFDRAHVKK